ncbi:hypothetical protein M0802_009966 [Mischocyttarus mexicanus]|nr:hypothetical protein M0802_009966 [Mischocyttarus mexicanus]
MEVLSCSASDLDTECSVYLTTAYASKIELKGGFGTLLLEDDLFINSWTYYRFEDARNSFQLVTTRNLQEWAFTAASQFQSETFEFKASEYWVTVFKRNNRISKMKITRYVTEKESFNTFLPAA